MSQALLPGTVVCAFVVPGEPKSKARARVVRKNGRVFTFTPGRTRLAEIDIGLLAKAALRGRGVDGETKFGVRLDIRAGTRHRRDIDNTAKLCLDALNGIVWADDMQVEALHVELARGVDDPGIAVEVYAVQSRSIRLTMACDECGKPVRYFPGRGRRYCSSVCSRRAQTSSVRIPCAHCGKELSRAPNRLRRGREQFCSKTCKSKHQSVERPCVICGQVYKRPLSWAKKRTTTCSAQCAAKLANAARVSRAAVPCACGGMKSDARKASCKACFYKRMAKGDVGRNGGRRKKIDGSQGTTIEIAEET